MIRLKRGLAILLSTCMIGGMMPLPVRAEGTASGNAVQEASREVKEITAWEWIEKDASDPVLDDNHQLVLSATEDAAIPYDEITAILPDKISADIMVENVLEENTEVSISGWNCAGYPAEGAYEGSYTFQAELEEGYALAEDADAPEIAVIFDTPVVMADAGTGSFIVTGVEGGYAYSTLYGTMCLKISKAGTYSVSMSEGAPATTDAIEITANDGIVDLTIENLKINVASESTSSPIIVRGGATLNLTVKGMNSLSGQESKKEMYTPAGICVEETGSLLITKDSTGTLKATGAERAAGIGGNYSSSSGYKAGSITIAGGTVEAYGGREGAGIGAGSGYKSSMKKVEITGGTVYAYGGDKSAGIGTGYNSSVEKVEITGGTVYANGGAKGAGIGAGISGKATELIISDGKVTATGGEYGAGIGVGCSGTATSIKISGGTVIAYGGKGKNVDEGGAGIGTSSGSSVNTIEISGGKVTATGGYNGAGAGTGFNGSVTDITISGGEVTVNGGDYGAGVGTGYNGKATNITISGGEVTATGGYNGAGAGIGAGRASSIAVETINIKNTFVKAKGYNGIGAGLNGRTNTVKNINISNSVVYADKIHKGYNAATTSDWTGIQIAETGSGFYGENVTIPVDFTIEADKTLTIPAGKTLTIAEGKTMTNNGKVRIDGTINGNIVDNGQTLLGINATQVWLNDRLCTLNTKEYVSVNAEIVVTKYIPDENQGLIGWKIDGITFADGTNPDRDTQSFTFRMPSNAVSIEALSGTKVTPPSEGVTFDKTADSITAQEVQIPQMPEGAIGVQYRLGSDGIWQNTDTATFTGLTADTEYTVYVRYRGDDTHADSNETAYTVKTKKWATEANIINKPVNLTATYGDELSRISLNAFSGWRWKDDAQKISTRDVATTYAAVFTPEDTDAYDYSQMFGYALDAAGKPTVTIGLDVKVERALPVLGWDSDAQKTQNAIYTGSPIASEKITKPTITLKLSDTYTGEIAYSFRPQGSSEAYETGLPTDRGSYEVIASIPETENYHAASTSEPMVLTIDWLNTDAVATVQYKNAKDENMGGTMGASATLSAPAGYTISGSPLTGYGASFTYRTETQEAGTEISYYLKNTEGEVAEKKVTLKIDRTGPSWEGGDCGIKIKSYTWKALLHKITFGRFYNDDTVDITIKAVDTMGSVKTYYYWIDDSGSTIARTSADLDKKSFQSEAAGASGDVTIQEPLNSDRKYVVYAYAVDESGNKSAYISSDGMVADKTAPVMSGFSTPSKETGTLTGAAVRYSFSSDEDGSFFYILKEKTVGMTAPASSEMASCVNPDGTAVWSPGTEVTMQSLSASDNNEITIENLKPVTEYILYVAAGDKAGNISDVTVLSFKTLKGVPIIIDNPVLTGTYGDHIGEMIATGGTVSVTGTWKLTDTNTEDVPEVGTDKTYEVTFTPADTDTYESVSTMVAPAVKKKSITVTAENGEKAYGEANPAFTYTVDQADMVGSDYDNFKEVLAVTLSTTATAASPVTADGYPITGTADSKNYDVTVTPAVLTIRRIDAEIQAKDIAEKYRKKPFMIGAAGTNTDQEARFTYTAIEGSDIVDVADDGAVTAKKLGEAKIKISLAQTTNYNAAEKEIKITVDRGEAVLNVEKDSYTATYGDEDIDLGLEAEGESEILYTTTDDKVATAERGKLHIVGTGTATITLSMAESTNYYAAEKVEITVKVDPAQLTVKADDKSIEYGADAPVYTVTYEGFKNGDAADREGVLTGTLGFDCSYQKGDAAYGKAGTYDITPKGLTGRNYDIVYKAGTLTVKPEVSEPEDDSDSNNNSSSADYEKRNPKPDVNNGTGNRKPNSNRKPTPAVEPAAEVKPSAETRPYLRDDSGKEGWDVISSQLANAGAGEAVTVTMNGTTVVPKNVIDSIKSEDITLVLDMGNGISWKINGKDITQAAGDIDFGVTIGENAGKTIPVEVINNVTGERFSMNLTLAYSGEFGFTATLTVNMEAKNAGLYANLFYYNEQTGELEFVSAGQIDADGNAELDFTHASDYTIVIDAIVMDGRNGESVTFTENTEAAEEKTIPVSNEETTGDAGTWNPTIIFAFGICILAIAFGAVIYMRKKSGSEQE